MLINYRLFTIFLLVFAFFKNKNDLHMFQLNSYRVDRYLRWRKGKKTKFFFDYDSLMLVGIIIFAFAYSFLDTLILQIFFSILASIIISLSVFIFVFRMNKSPVKKKLVYTNRVKRLITTMGLIYIVISGIIIGFSNVFMLFLATIINIYSYFVVLLANSINSPIENIIKNKLISESKKLLKKNKNLIIIGITGSYGKTSTKNLLYDLLKRKYHVLITPESYNTLFGVIRTIREKLKPTHEIFIVEMGAKELGDIKEICDLVVPDMGIITSIGEQHLETFKNLSNIIRTKGELFEGIKPGGKAFLNLSDKNIMKLKKRSDIEYISFNKLSEEIKGNYYAKDITISSKGTNFKLVNKDGYELDIRTKLLGRHNIDNLVGCIAIALELGVEYEKINKLLYDIEPIKHRLSYSVSRAGYVILDDAFNSNPIGSKNALEVLRKFEGNKKIVMTPGMIELGDKQHELNEKLGEYIAESADFVVLVGKEQTKAIFNGLMKKSYNKNNIYIASNLNDGFEKINLIIDKDDVLLIENDLPDTFNE